MQDIIKEVRKISPKGSIKIIPLYKSDKMECFRVNVYASSGLTNTIDKSFFVKKEGERITL
jgi:hypothetical protein